jgi:DNA-directed RNA polymerase subunit RPC12/RpoP
MTKKEIVINQETMDQLLGNLQNMVQVLQSVSDTEEEPKKPVKKKRGRPKKKKAPEKKPPKKKVDDEFIMDQQKRSRTPVFVHNRFEDMENLDIDKPDGYDKIDDSTPRSKRSRKSYASVELSCSNCGKKVSTHPMFKKDNFVCDRCVSKKFGG